MTNLLLGIYSILRWLLIACVLPIWYIGALQNNSLESTDEEVVLGFASIIWILAVAIIICGQ